MLDMWQKYVIGFVLILVILYIFNKKKEGLIDQPSNLLPVLKPPKNYKYVYYPMLDSPGNNIRQNVFQKGNVDELKRSCDAYAHCVGFNTNGWLKHQILPSAQWKAWGVDPHKGLYVKRPL